MRRGVLGRGALRPRQPYCWQIICGSPQGLGKGSRCFRPRPRGRNGAALCSHRSRAGQDESRRRRANVAEDVAAAGGAARSATA